MIIGKPNSNHRHSGFTLLEMLIVLVIASIVLLGSTTIVSTSADSRHRVSNIRKLQEEATLLTQLFQHQLSQIAYRSIDDSLISTRHLPVQHQNVVFPAVAGDWEAGQVIKADGASITFRHSGASTIDGEADGTIFSCMGDTVSQDEIVETRFFLIDRQLGCTVADDTQSVSGSTSSTGIDEMLVEIGIDRNNDSSIDEIILATEATDEDFSNTRLLRIRLLLSSEDGALNFNQNYSFNGEDRTSDDFRIYKEVVVASAIRN